MAKKAQKIKKGKRSELLIVNPDAAGIDISSTEYQVCVPEDRDGNFNRVFDTFTCSLMLIVEWLKACNIKTVAMESTGIYWIQLFLILQENGFEVCLVNAKHIKQIGDKKTDVVDAHWIQVLHSYGLLRASFQPDNKVRELRNLIRHRNTMVKSGSKEALHMQKALETMNIKVHKVLSDILGKSGQDIVKAVIDGERDPRVLAGLVDPKVKASHEELVKSLEANWSDDQLFILKKSYNLYHYFQSMIREFDVEIEKTAVQLQCTADISSFESSGKGRKRKNGLNFNAEQMLYKIWGVNTTLVPGIDTLSSLKLISELGRDFTDKFPSDKQFVSWSNIVPNNKISGGKLLSSKIPRRKNPVGQVFRMAASTLAKNKSPLGDYYRAIKARQGKKQAVVATAHKLARIFFAMIKNQVEFDPNLIRNHQLYNREEKIKRLKKLLSKLEEDLKMENTLNKQGCYI